MAGQTRVKTGGRLSRKGRWTLVGLATVLGVFLASWLAGNALMAPAPARVELPTDMQGTEISFASKSGAILRGNFLPGQRGRGVVVLMHGIRGHRGALVQHAEMLHENGLAVLFFDFQAHGESTGSHITSGYRESMDAVSAAAFARQKAPGEKLGVLGISLGGAAALLADPPLNADALVLEMSYPDIERAVKNRFEMPLGKWARVLSPLLTCQIKWRIGVSAEWFSPERAIAKTPGPKLILAGAEDHHTTIDDTHSLFNSASEPKELWVVPGAGHENLYAIAKKEYEDRVLTFFQKHLPRN